MSHNFNWEKIPDSSKLREQEDESLTDNSKFYFGDIESLDKYSEVLFEPMTTTDSINISLSDINNLNVVINDDECSDNFIEAICQQLDLDGVEYSFSRQEDNLNVQNAVVITLDQQYVSGPRVSIIGVYDNNRDDNSDVLALAMDTAFRSKGVDSDGVFCGKRGYRETAQGMISTRIPTPTEETIPSEAKTSLVTISFGTNTPSAEEIASIIEDGLGRYLAYVSVKNNSDLIYRAGPADSLDSLAARFGSTALEVSSLNNIDSVIPSDEAIINPVDYGSIVFDKTVSVRVEEIKNNKALK